MRVFLVFQNSKNKRWWNFFTREGYEHVDLMVYKNDIMTCLSPSYNDFIVYSTSEFKTLNENNLYDNIKLYEIKDFNVLEKTTKIFMLGTCVGICKKFLRIKNPLIFTPYQLLRYLEKKEKIWQIHLPGQQ